MAWKLRQDRWRCSDRAVQKTLSSSRNCERLEPSSSARPISASGRIFVPAILPAVGADAVAKQRILTRLIAIPAALAQAQALRLAQIYAPWPWERKPTAR